MPVVARTEDRDGFPLLQQGHSVDRSLFCNCLHLCTSKCEPCSSSIRMSAQKLGPQFRTNESESATFTRCWAISCEQQALGGADPLFLEVVETTSRHQTRGILMVLPGQPRPNIPSLRTIRPGPLCSVMFSMLLDSSLVVEHSCPSTR